MTRFYGSRLLSQLPHQLLRRGQSSAMFAALVVLASCGGGGDGIVTVTPPTKTAALTAVQLSQSSLTLVAGQTGSLQATLVGPGASTGQGTTAFEASPATVATVNASGVVTAVGPGTATVTVTGSHPSTSTLNASTVSASAQVTVTAAPNALTDVTVAPATPSVAVGATLQLVLTITKGSAAVTSSCSYTSGSISVATVSQTGVVTGFLQGSVNITITCNGSGTGFTANTIVRTVSVAVTPPPVATIELTVPNSVLQPGPGSGRISTTVGIVLKDAAGNPLTGRTVTWLSQNTNIATVSGTGLVAAQAVGTTTIRATSEGINQTVTINVVRAFGAVNADQPTTSTYDSGTNSTGGTNTIQRTATGRYTITFNGIGVEAIGRQFMYMANAKSASSNAVSAAPTAVCHVQNGTNSLPVTLLVRCENPVTGADKDAEFRAMLIGDFALEGNMAFTLHSTGNTTTYTPNVNFSFNSAQSAMSIVPNAAPGTFSNLLTRHFQGLTVASQMSFAQVITQSAGITCHTRDQNLAATSADILCYDRSAAIVDATNQVLRVTAGRAGQVFGTAFLNGTNGSTTGQGVASSGTVVTSRTANGKYTVTFPGLVPASGPFGVIAAPWSSNDWVHCTHFVVAVNPLTIDVACFDKTGTFSQAPLSAVQLLVLQ